MYFLCRSPNIGAFAKLYKGSFPKDLYIRGFAKHMYRRGFTNLLHRWCFVKNFYVGGFCEIPVEWGLQRAPLYRFAMNLYIEGFAKHLYIGDF